MDSCTVKPFFCSFCRRVVRITPGEHFASIVHRYNLIVHFNLTHSKYIAQDRYGVRIRVQWLNNGVPNPRLRYFPERGNYYLDVSQKELKNLGSVFEFRISFFNMTNETIRISHGSVLKGQGTMYDKVNNDWLNSDARVCLRARSAYYNVHISYNIKDIICGKHSIPFGFDMIVGTGNVYISRTIIINVSPSGGWTVVPQPNSKPRSPYVKWKPVDKVVAPVQPGKLNNYNLDKDVVQCIMGGLKDCDAEKPEQSEKYQEICQTMKAGLRFDNYRAYFHNCLWVEENFNASGIQSNCLEKVHAMVTKEGDLVFNVPYLPERRNVLLGGNTIRIKSHGGNEAFEGIIKNVQRSQVRIRSLSKRFLNSLCKSGDTTIDVQFQLGRLPMERKHQGVDMVVSKKHMGMLFPDEITTKKHEEKYKLNDEDFVNQDVVNNTEQRTAVTNILNSSSQEAPYIVFGPPGTGKTVTIVEAICQILKKTDKKILVCAPANAHCDMLTARLMKYCKPNELCRAYSFTRNPSDVPAELRQYTNMGGNCRFFGQITAKYLNKFRVVVSTLIFIGKFNDTLYNPDFIFIDEAAQASEPEVCVALSRLPKGGQLVLAGDPKQLKPLVICNVAQKYGLNISLLQRLITTQKIYQNEDPRFITMLKKNFRSHPNILQIPNRLFYEDKLEPVSKDPLSDPISKIDVFPYIQNMANGKVDVDDNDMGKALEFCAVSAAEHTDGISPSYFNSQEATMVMQYVRTLLKIDVTPAVKMSDIGVIAPYTKQVVRTKQLLEVNKFHDVNVGTVETFQGREKRIIILSTVRGQFDPLKCDNSYNLGFLRQPERFNVAITRAISKLIVIGCPMVLAADEKWNQIIRTCIALNTYHGVEPEKRNDSEYALSLEKFQKFSLLSEQLEKLPSTSLLKESLFSVLELPVFSADKEMLSDGSLHGEETSDSVDFEIDEKNFEVIEGVVSDFEWVDSDSSDSARSDFVRIGSESVSDNSSDSFHSLEDDQGTSGAPEIDLPDIEKLTLEDKESSEDSEQGSIDRDSDNSNGFVKIATGNESGSKEDQGSVSQSPESESEENIIVLVA